MPLCHRWLNLIGLIPLQDSFMRASEDRLHLLGFLWNVGWWGNMWQCAPINPCWLSLGAHTLPVHSKYLGGSDCAEDGSWIGGGRGLSILPQSTSKGEGGFCNQVLFVFYNSFTEVYFTYYTFHQFQVYNSVIFSNFTNWCIVNFSTFSSSQ